MARVAVFSGSERPRVQLVACGVLERLTREVLRVIRYRITAQLTVAADASTRLLKLREDAVEG